MSRGQPAGKSRTGRPSLWSAAALAALLGLGLGKAHHAYASAGAEPTSDSASLPSDPGADARAAREAPRRRDWKRIVQRVRQDLSKRRISAIAAGATFYSLLAIFPAIAALVALYGL